jgi:hypothetical protein
MYAHSAESERSEESACAYPNMVRLHPICPPYRFLAVRITGSGDSACAHPKTARDETICPRSCPATLGHVTAPPSHPLPPRPRRRAPSMLMVVVLPAPLGPSIPKHSPWLTPMVSVFTATLDGLPMYAGYTCPAAAATATIQKRMRSKAERWSVAAGPARPHYGRSYKGWAGSAHLGWQRDRSHGRRPL